MSHYGEKPFRCSTCGRGFVRKDYYLDHIKNQNCVRSEEHADKINNNVKVDHEKMAVGESYYDQYAANNQNTDEAENEDQECEICHQMFSSVDELEMHAGMHMEEGFYVCRLCNTRFSTGISLEFHLMQHKKEDSETAELEAVAMETDAPSNHNDKTTTMSTSGDEKTAISNQLISANQHGAYTQGNSSKSLFPNLSMQLSKFGDGSHFDQETRSFDPVISRPLLKNILLGTPEHSMDNNDKVFSALDLSKEKINDKDPIHNNNNNSDMYHSSSKIGFIKESIHDVSGNVSNCDEASNVDKDDLNSTGTSEQFDDGSLLDSSSQCSSPTQGKSDTSTLNVPDVTTATKPGKKAPYKCDICGAVFTRIDNMKVHRKRHNGEKDFMCNECGQSFTRKATLKKHQISAHRLRFT